MLRRIFFAVPAALVLFSCSGKDSPNPVEPSRVSHEPTDTATYSLEVVIGEGVTGEPGSGIHTYNVSERVSYHYEAKAGFDNLFVIVDSANAEATGAFVMNRDIKISTGAREIPIVPPEDEEIVQSAQEVLSSPVAEEAYMEYVDKLADLYELYGADEAEERAQAISKKAFGEADFASIQAMQESLSGKVFDFSELESEHSFSSSIAPATSNDAGVDVYFVNGIFVPGEDGGDATLHLIHALKGQDLPFFLPVRLFYNGSAYRHMESDSYCLIAWGESCPIGVIVDLGEAATQLLSTFSFFDDLRSEEEARELADIIKVRREMGRSVILVGHSQGNLMIYQALKELEQPDDCIAVVSVASPGSKEGWNVRDDQMSGFAVKGDLVGDFIIGSPLFDFPTIKTTLTESFDKSLRAEKEHPQLLKLVEELRLHYFLGSYMSAPESRDNILNMISEYALDLSGRESCNPPDPSSGEHLYASSLGEGLVGSSDLWMVPVDEDGVDTFIAKIHTESGLPLAITDLAMSPSGELWGVSFDDLYRIDKETGIAEKAAYFESIYPNSAAFSPQGDLYVAGIDGDILGIDVEKMEAFWSGSFGNDYKSAGDMAFAPDGRWYALVEDYSGADRFTELSLDTGNVIAAGEPLTDFPDIFGLSFVDSVPFGLTAGKYGKGSLLRFDIKTGRPKLVRSLGFSASGSAGDRDPDR